MITEKLNCNRFTRAVALVLVAMAALVGTSATAQTTTGTIRGTVTTAGLGAGSANAQIQLRNPQTGVSRGTISRDDGTYVLAGLIPATYEMTVRRIGSSPVTRIVTVQIGTSQVQDFSLSQQAAQLEAVQVRAAGAIDTRTSEVSTNVTQAQIAKLPTASRNFLDLAALTPGVSVTEDRINGASRTVSAGGQSSNAVNLFIDGTSFKNDLTNGGIAGQDASKGNPFPRGAIQEYRVISQNFKAEYQKASSAVITATTKSGTNDFKGNLVYSYQDQGLVALDTFQLADKRKNANFRKPDYKRNLAALSVGGPIIKDKLHFFGTYEGNYQDRNNRVNFAPPTGFTAIDTVNFTKYNGNFTSPFRETLLFGKLSLAASDKSSAEFSVSDRIETDIRDFGGRQAYEEAVNYRQNIGVGQVKYNYFSGSLLNEAKADYSRFRRNPSPNNAGIPGRQFFFPDNTDNQLGSNRSTQDFIQKRFAIRDDLTYTGFEAAGDHVFKVGGNVDFVKYDVIKDNDGTPVFRYRQTESGRTYNFATPYELFYGTGDPKLNENNTQVGLYAQDDWRPVPQLTLNLGIRWDYESNMLNNDFVTNANAADTLRRYNSQFPNPLNLDRYISDGNSRKAFLKAFQPRLGFSYAVDQAARTTVFGGFGIYYDRVPFDLVIDEKLKLSHPSFTVRFAPRGVAPLPGQIAWNDSYLGANKSALDALVGTFGKPEAWFIDNEAKVPWSKQWSLGLRQAIGTFTVAGTYAGVRGYDQFTMNWAQFGLNPNGSCCKSFDIGAHGYSNFIYSSNGKKTWYDSFQLQVDRPYQRAGEKEWGWGLGLAYTYAIRSLQGTDGLDDLFAFPNDDNIPKHPSNDEKQRVVTNWIVDIPYLWGIQFSGLATFGGKYKIDVGCPVRFCGDAYKRGGFTVPGTFPYRMVDIRLRKDFPEFSNARLGVTADVFNVFNRNNYGCFNTGNPNDANFGKPGCVVSDPRRLQVGLEVDY